MTRRWPWVMVGIGGCLLAYVAWFAWPLLLLSWLDTDGGWLDSLDGWLNTLPRPVALVVFLPLLLLVAASFFLVPGTAMFAVVKLTQGASRWLRTRRQKRESGVLTVETLNKITSDFGAYLETTSKEGVFGYGREKDLPHPKPLIEAALVKAMLITPNDDHFERLALGLLYLDHALPEHEWALVGASDHELSTFLERWRSRLLDEHGHPRNSLTDEEARDMYEDSPGLSPAGVHELREEINKRGQQRLEQITRIRLAREGLRRQAVASAGNDPGPKAK